MDANVDAMSVLFCYVPFDICLSFAAARCFEKREMELVLTGAIHTSIRLLRNLGLYLWCHLGLGAFFCPL